VGNAKSNEIEREQSEQAVQRNRTTESAFGFDLGRQEAK
jgi:hypothetical protein